MPISYLYDCLIAGGSYIGLSVAIAVKASAPHMKICLVDSAPEEAICHDERASAIAVSASRMLNQLGIWRLVKDEAQSIREMIVTDSRTDDPIRPIFLTFGRSKPTEIFAYMVPNRSLIMALRNRVRELEIETIHDDKVHSFTTSDLTACITLKSGNQLHTRLLIAADGVNSSLREQSSIRVVRWDYNQTAIVTTITHERDHNGRAEEHLLPGGPFAMLPLRDNRTSLVWSEPTLAAKELLASDKETFSRVLQNRLGHKLGPIYVDSPHKGFPITLTLAREFVRHRFVLVGDAAHVIHPIAGQGLNLGFKDVSALAKTIVEAERLNLDIGLLTILEHYQRSRRFDTVKMSIMTDMLNRLFSNDHSLLRFVRMIGLGIVDRTPTLKQFFINQASS
ncbi:FAD-dependent monooxygenase [Candidatus Endowatersipora endosymbiont of Watersipora subatra]|uniref:FAD-dependent monooxygenase n=1 Tax=Candidatus Endowatersipora endosymbiont of Watersipora subatra TaxID=3077946 RepID=UPI00312CA4E1